MKKREKYGVNKISKKEKHSLEGNLKKRKDKNKGYKT